MELDYRNDEMEIDLKEIIIILLKKWWLIGAAAILCAALVLVYGKLIVKPVYKSTGSILVMNQRDEAGSDGYLNQSLRLYDDYEEIIKSRMVVNEVIKNLGLEKGYKEIVSKIDVNIPNETRIIEISVTDEDPKCAQMICEETRLVAMDKIADLFEVYAIKTIDEAEIPEDGIINFPIKKLFVLAFGGGACMVVLALVIMYLMDGTIKNEDHVKQYLCTIMLGEVTKENKDADMEVLKTNVKASKEALKTIAITQSKETEGAEQIAFDLAVACAESDSKVLYIDANMRIESKEQNMGLGNFLSADKKLEDICMSEANHNLSSIAAGSCEKPSALLDGKKFASLLEEAKKVYDVIIINTPAIGKYIDAAIVAKQCDGTILVIKEGKTKYQLAQKAMIQLAYVDADVMGCILNK